MWSASSQNTLKEETICKQKRNLAVKISAELFDRLKEYLEKNHLKQKDFITQLIQQALDNAEE